MRAKILTVTAMILTVVLVFGASALGADRNTETEICTVKYSQTMEEPAGHDYKIVIETQDGNEFVYYTYNKREAYADRVEVKFDTKGTPTREDDRVIEHKRVKD